MNKVWTVVLLLCAMALGACANPMSPSENTQSSVAVNSATIVAETSPPPELPEAGKATVVGKVLSEKTGQPLADTIVRLAETYREGGEGAYVLSGASSPGDITDSVGVFVMPNIEAREYVLIVGDIYAEYVVIPQPSGLPKTWNPEAGKIMDVGEIRVSLGGQ